ncbi:YusU family protein [Bacillus tianshenii]|nr:YusU family protein [Bacillus tianshenii]
MEQQFVQQFDALLEKYTELLVGETDSELKAKVQMWALYNQVAKSMPALAKHWNETYPEAKQEMRALIKEIQQLNEAHRSEMDKRKNDESH